MRTDLTVRTAAGAECDVAVFAPSGTTWEAVAALVRAAVPETVPRWCGSRTLSAGAVIGLPPLVSGAVLTAERPAVPPRSTMRLAVVGGRGIGAGVAVGATTLTVGRAADCDLVLDGARVSRHHLRVSSTTGGLTATDLGSTDGMYERGRRVGAARLTHDTVLRVGTSFLAVTDLPGTTPHPCSIELPAPPQPQARPPRLPVLATVLPAVLGAGLALLTGSWEFLAFAAMTPAAAVAGAVGERRQARRRNRRELARFRREHAAAETARTEALRAEAMHRRSEHPCVGTVSRARRTVRDTADPDLLRVRVGLGALPSRLQRGCEVADVPVTIDLAVGPVALVGPHDVTRDLARALLVQVATSTSPRDVALTMSHRDEWEWARWLPAAMPSHARHVIAVGDPTPADRATTAIVLVEHVADVPSGCRTRVVVADETSGTVRVHGADGTVRTAIVDRIDSAHAEHVARALAGTTCDPPSGGDVPAECRLTDLIGDTDVSARWAGSDGAARATIGVSAEGAVTVDLDRDGPHLLVAGSTGAGKSELLQCLVAGLALNQPPAEVSFLLIDYKGGAAFGECARLPHTVGLVTDLDAQLTRRVLTALDSEIDRRERLFASVGAADLDSYRKAGRSPLARLVVVVDEFATLADELGNFVPNLVAIARRGRSLGLHLVLATQRPSGVVSPEIRANTALRICLRVTSAAESIDVVDTAAAADIAQDTPGRAVLRSGSAISHLQTARVSAAARDTTGVPRVVRLGAWRALPAAPDRAVDTDLARIVARIRAAHEGEPLPHRPWLAPLPRVLTLAELDVSDGVAIGRIDLPRRQQQPPLTVDVDHGTTVLITGRARSGRSTTLHTIAHALAARHRPDELHVYGIDATGDGLAPLRALPHAGTVVTTEDGFDLVARLVERLLTTSHRALLLIDGWDELLSASDDFDGGRTAEHITSLLRTASRTQLTAVVTGGRATLAPRLTSLATARFLLALNDDAEYCAAGVATQGIPTAPPPGRGLRVGDWSAVQFAIVDPSATVTGEPDPDAVRLRPLPRSVSLAQLPPGGGVVLGRCGDACGVADIDLVGTHARVLIAGPPRSGRTTALCTILRQSNGCAVVAPSRSPLSIDAARAGHRIVHGPDELPETGLLLVDDLEQIADSALGDAIAAWAATAETGRAVVAAGRADALGLGYRGLVALLRAQCCGVLLRPSAADANLLGVAVATSRILLPPGRGVLVPDPRWGLGSDPIPIQVATP